MNKKQWFIKSLVPIDKRLPPDNGQQVLYWNAESKRYNTTRGEVLCTQHRQLKSGVLTLDKIREQDKDCGFDHLGYFATHWMPLYPMEDG